ncbi:MAG: DUF4920 domain-containing protein [Flavobacteriales bacterium]|nr:DUF4920 domain-containing protein [Flavobacteriales bacterium]
MRPFTLLLVLPLAFHLQAQQPATAVGANASYTNYGDAITPDGAIGMAEFEAAAARKDSLEAKVEGEIIESCTKKGCWMTVKMSDGSPMMVRFRDYGFFVPKQGLEGKEVVMQGRAKKEETSVAMLRHYAEDAGKSKEEIAAITEPEISWKFEADGVLIKE